ncbi:MAG: SusC/RagA family TonB-linked outer membrane protein [Bacteroidales bacterium]|nr:SusC/RagA family TonB-linked outer membrane protein [Bacteroidales bacterium]
MKISNENKKYMFNVFFFLFVAISSISAIEVDGIVRDRTMKPVSEAIVKVINTGETIITDDLGYFSYSNESLEVINLLVSAENYEDLNLVFKAKTKNIRVELNPVGNPTKVNTLWGKVERDEFNGSVVVLKGDDLNEIATGDLSNMLTGRVPGLITVQQSIKPGYDGARTYMRGRGAPLVYVDGRISSLNSVSIEDVESITILKDISASNMHGVRGLNGAILVETKSGFETSPQITFKSELTYNQFKRIPQSVNSAHFARAYNQAALNSGQTEPVYSNEDIALYESGVSPLTHPNVDWQNELLKKGYWTNRNHLSICGGTKNVKYYVSLGFDNGTGIFNLDEEDLHSYSTNTEFKNYNLVSNIEFNPTKTSKVFFRMNGGRKDNNYPGTPNIFSDGTPLVYTSIVSLPPNIYPLYLPDDGKYYDQNGNHITNEHGRIAVWDGKRSNPWSQLNRNGYTKTSLMYGLVQTELQQDLSMVLPGLSFNSNIYFTITSDEDLNRRAVYNTYELLPDSSLFSTVAVKEGTMNNVLVPRSTNRRLSYDLQLAYQKEAGNHSINTTVNWNRYESANDLTVAARYESISLFAGYGYNDKYVLDATLTYGGVYNLPKDNKYRWYPTVSCGWILSNEEFFQAVKSLVSFAKLRASYGKVNAGGAPNFAYLEAVEQKGGVYYTGNKMGRVNGIYESLTPNPTIQNGMGTQLTVGVDVSFFKNKLDLGFDYFEDKREEMPIFPSASYTGVFGVRDVPMMNLGENQTKGYEVYASLREEFGKLGIQVAGNISYQKNEVLYNDEFEQEYEWMSRVGHPTGDFFGLTADGLYQSEDQINNAAALPNFANVQPGDIRYIDLDNSGDIDFNYDSKWIGHGEVPKIFYSLLLGAKFKGLDFSMLFQGASKVNRMISGVVRTPFNDNTLYEFQTDSWSESNPNAEWPIHTTTPSANNNTNSTCWLRNASYLRLKNLQLGYTLPGKSFNKLPISGLRVYVSGYNLLVWDDVEIIDPESSGYRMTIPAPASYCVDLKFTF